MNIKGQSTLENFEKILKVKNYSSNTISGYVLYVKEMILRFDKPAIQITSKEIREYLLNYQYSSISKQNTVYSALKLFARYILNIKFIEKVFLDRPRREKKLPKINKVKRRVFDKETNKIYSSIAESARCTGFNETKIRDWIKLNERFFVMEFKNNIRWNNGNLAILCSKCSKIIKEGKDFTKKELEAVEKSISLPAYYCEDCITKFKEIKSRHGDLRTFEKIPEGYLIWGESHYIRGIGKDIDFEGGPYLGIEMDLEYFGLEGIIKDIQFVEEEDKPNCYKLIINENKEC